MKIKNKIILSENTQVALLNDETFDPSCTFVEKDKAAIACIRKNLETTRFTEKASVYPFDVTTGLNDIHPGACFDMVFTIFIMFF